MTKDFRGVFTVMITPTHPDGSVNLDALRRFTDWQIVQGIHGLIPLGSTGEFLSLDDADRTAVAKCVIDTAAGRVPVLVGTGAEDTREVVRRSLEAQTLGADGVMVIPPFYATPTEDELVAHYSAIAGAIDIPVMVYNNPATSNVDLLPETVARIARIAGCDYIKESTMDVTRIRDILLLAGDDMTVFGGIMGFESFVEGAMGWVAVASNVAPAAMVEIFDRTMAGDLAGAKAVYHAYLPVIRAVGGQAYVGGSKALLTHMGFDAGTPLPPRLPVTPEADARLKAMVAEFGLSFAG
ncbi:dihydrodipicolinate synthase family protein [Mesobacterium pallidum]|uniref:dihydrodipicolinate synthase family protein n=1 Tax=Mesobacterium pallidum TaxID=2872037 RepID=UPI001EE25DE2|nr:dihydrodipicolinate synthase family protein [Mesobacterium pallidum]